MRLLVACRIMASVSLGILWMCRIVRRTAIVRKNVDLSKVYGAYVEYAGTYGCPWAAV